MVSHVRAVTIDDIPWLHAVCAAAYERGHYEPDAAEAWVRVMLVNPAYLVLRGTKAWIAVTVSAMPYAPEYRVAQARASPAVDPPTVDRSAPARSLGLSLHARCTRRARWIEKGPAAG